MDVAINRRIDGSDGSLIELGPRLLHDPCLQLRIRWLVLLDESQCRSLVQAECIQDHLVITCTTPGIALSQLTGTFQRDFLPKARKVFHAERTCHT